MAVLLNGTHISLIHPDSFVWLLKRHRLWIEMGDIFNSSVRGPHGDHFHFLNVRNSFSLILWYCNRLAITSDAHTRTEVKTCTFIPIDDMTIVLETWCAVADWNDSRLTHSCHWTWIYILMPLCRSFGFEYNMEATLLYTSLYLTFVCIDRQSQRQSHFSVFIFHPIVDLPSSEWIEWKIAKHLICFYFLRILCSAHSWSRSFRSSLHRVCGGGQENQRREISNGSR